MRDSPNIPDDRFAPRADLVLIASRSGSAGRSAMARNLETAIRERVSRIGQKEVARLAGIEKTKINRLMSEGAALRLEDLYPFFAALGMGVIECDDPEMVSLPRAELEALQTLARKALNRIADPRGQADV